MFGKHLVLMKKNSVNGGVKNSKYIVLLYFMFQSILIIFKKALYFCSIILFYIHFSGGDRGRGGRNISLYANLFISFRSFLSNCVNFNLICLVKLNKILNFKCKTWQFLHPMILFGLEASDK